MSKRFLTTVALVLVAVLCITAFVACNPTDEPDANKVTVTWYDGTTVLRADKVEKGSVITSWTPEVADKTFMDWYSDITLGNVFDFTKPINEDTDIFAGFKGAFVADETVWCLIGGGTGTLKGSAWQEDAEVEENFKLTRVEEEGVNKFQMTDVVLYEGDQFQIRAMGTWTGQRGVGYIEGYTPIEDAGDGVIGEVRVGEELYFTAKKGFGDSPSGWNAIVAKSGIYTLTLITNPGSSAYDVIKFERTGDAPVLEKTHDMFFIGTMNEWSTTYEEENDPNALTEAGNGAYWTGTITVDGETEFKIYNAVSGQSYSSDGEANMKPAAGTYMVKYTVEDNKVELEECKYYVYGTFVDETGAQVNYEVREGITPVMTVADGVATVELTTTDVTASYDWMTTQGKLTAEGEAAKFAIKVYYGTTFGRVSDYGQEGGDNIYLAVGTYTITFDIETSTVTATPVTPAEA